MIDEAEALAFWSLEVGRVHAGLFETELWDLVEARLRSDHDLALSWFEPMRVIDSTPSCRVIDIAETLSITIGGTSKLIDRIENAGWCERSPNPDAAAHRRSS